MQTPWTEGMTYACENITFPGSVNTLLTCCRFGADGGIKDINQNLPLHYAVMNNQANIVDLLLNKYHIFEVCDHWTESNWKYLILSG